MPELAVKNFSKEFSCRKRLKDYIFEVLWVLFGTEKEHMPRGMLVQTARYTTMY